MSVELIITVLEGIYEGLKNQFFDSALSLFIPQVFIFNYETGIFLFGLFNSNGMFIVQ